MDGWFGIVIVFGVDVLMFVLLSSAAPRPQILPRGTNKVHSYPLRGRCLFLHVRYNLTYL